jgi:hypothetical protein
VGQRGPDHPQVAGNNAPTDPPAKAILAVIQATPQVVLADQDANPAFNTGVETTTPFEPGLFLVTASLG